MYIDVEVFFKRTIFKRSKIERMFAWTPEYDYLSPFSEMIVSSF